MIEVLSVTSEVYPLIKTGGLADVAGALPGALTRFGVHVRTLVPGYPKVLEAMGEAREVAQFEDLWGGPVQLVATEAMGLDLLIIKAPHLYERSGGPYGDPEGRDWLDNWKRFAALGFAAAELAQGLVKGYQPQIVHAHDWQAGLAPAYLKYNGPAEVKTVMTVHNLAFQGRFSAEIFGELGLPAEAFAVDGVEYYGGVGFLKAGLQCADKVTTVSPTYANEIRTPEHGMGLDGLLNERAADLVGILNGIDVKVWDPGADEALAAQYRAGSVDHRGTNKQALTARFGLESDEGPLFGVVSRLTWQKGMDLLIGCIDDLVERGGRLCVLGSGDHGLEQALIDAAQKHPGKVGVITAYDEQVSHLIQGGADAILIPSRFEPCGLTQLYGLRYGCVPVVARVGGLADTVIDANEAALEAGVATGIQFTPVTEPALREAIRRTIMLYQQPKVWKRIQRRGMKAEVSWEASAERYAELYSNLLGRSGKNDD
mgnify:CR=1 FL=1